MPSQSARERWHLIGKRFLLLTGVLCALLGRAQPASTPRQVTAAPPGSRELIEQMLSWFPADTETVLAANGPIVMPQTTQASKGAVGIEGSGGQVRDSFKLPLALLGLMEHFNFKDASIVAAIEGSREFRAPSGLGMATFQGATVAVFADDISVRAGEFLKDSGPTIVRTERMEGQSVAVFKRKLEEDIWTTYVAFPRGNMAVVATDEGYLREVLARINGKQGERALPDTLPEWRYVNTQASFWAVRHFRHGGGKASLTSGFSGVIPDRKPDERSVGFAFGFDPNRSDVATITYLSGDESTLQTIQKSLFSEREAGVREMHAKYRAVQDGVLEGTYNLEKISSAQYFLFVLEALLGHAIFV